MRFAISLLIATAFSVVGAETITLHTKNITLPSGETVEISSGTFTSPENTSRNLKVTERDNSILKRDSCGDPDHGLFNTKDAEKLRSNLVSIAPELRHHLGTQSWIGWTVGSVRVCVKNNWIFKQTDVKEWEVGWGVGVVMNQCCLSYNPQCQGGWTHGHGVEGNQIDIGIFAHTRKCAEDEP